jgi:ribokinase
MPWARPVVTVVGSANVDLVSAVERAPAAGETVLGTGFARGFGGKGANQAVMAARFAADVVFIGAVGDDEFGNELLANFRRTGVSTFSTAVRPGSSGLASIWVEADGTNRIVVTPGANGLVDPGAAATAIARLTTVDVVVGQLEIPQPATTAAFEAAKARGAATILNPAPAATLDRALLAASDWLVPNEGELDRLAGGTGVAGDDAAVRRYAARLGRALVVTLGSAGAILATADGLTRVPAPQVVAVDSTGAGDAFVGAFAVGIGLGLSPAEAVRLGVLCGSESVIRAGAQASYPDRARTAELLAQAISQPSGPGTNASSSG